MKHPRSYTVNGALAAGVLCWALYLSRSGRTAVDWTVIVVVSLAILWNLVNLGRRLHRSGGAKAVWHLQRTLLFWIVGLFNTALARPADVGSWKNLVGWVFLVLAAADTVVLWREEQQPREREPNDLTHLA
jgi:hypothetical protein